MSPGALPVWAGLLTPQGKCLFDFIVWADGDDLLLDCEAEAADDLIKRLAIYRLRRPIAIERDDALAVHWSRDGDEGVPDPRLAELGRRWLAPAGEPAAGLARASPAPRRLRRPRRARRHPLARMQCRRTERRQLHQGLLRRPGEYRADELALQGQPPAGRGRRPPSPARAPASHYPELGLAVEHRRVDDLDGAIIPDWLQASITA